MLCYLNTILMLFSHNKVLKHGTIEVDTSFEESAATPTLAQVNNKLPQMMYQSLKLLYEMFLESWLQSKMVLKYSGLHITGIAEYIHLIN